MAISKDQIDLWSADLDAGEYSEAQACELLSPDERDRAQRFRFPLHRSRYTIRRGILRTLLGRYLDQTPESILFSYGSHGKPLLSGHGLHFNLSHSGAQACFAFSPVSPLGIDIERVRAMPDLLHAAGGFCSSTELAVLRSLSPDQQTQAFFRCWTRKEALVKALGPGLSYPLDRISVSFEEPARLLDVQHNPSELMQWHFHSWDPGSDYLGAIVSRNPDSRIVMHRYSANG
ncbi:MAG TPA: 4'-phosphopantetheinyl transferase superfamily protein [Acidobacteriaceae bacterium]